MPVKLIDEEHPIRLRNRIKELYRKKTFADILLRSSDGSTYRTHRLVLATYSDYFKPFASRKNQNGNQALEVVDLDIKASILSSLVDYIYKGYIEIKPKLQPELQRAAELLELQDVVNLLEGRTLKSTDSDNTKTLKSVGKQPPTSKAKSSAKQPVDKAPAKGRPKKKSLVPVETDSQFVRSESGKVNARRQSKRKSNIPEVRDNETNEALPEETPKGATRRKPKRKSSVDKEEPAGKGAKRAKKNSEDVYFERSQSPDSDFEIELDVCEDEEEPEMEPVHQLKVEAVNETWLEDVNQIPSVVLTPLQLGSLEEESSTRDSYELEEVESKASVLKQLEIAESVNSPSAYDEDYAVEETKFKPHDEESPGKSAKSKINDFSSSSRASKKRSVVDSEYLDDGDDDFELQKADEDEDDDYDDDYNPDEDLYGPFILKTPKSTSKKCTDKSPKKSNQKRKSIKVQNLKKLHIAKKKSKGHKSKLIAAKIKNQKLLFLCENNAILNTETHSEVAEGRPKYKCKLCKKTFKHKSVCRGHIHKMHVQKKIGIKHERLKQQKFEKFIPLPKTRSTSESSKKRPVKLSMKIKQLKTMKNSAANPELYFPSKPKCLICERLLKDRHSLYLHLQSVHKMSATEARQHESNLNRCEVAGCDFSTFKIRELVYHVKSEHPEIEHRCPVCNFTFYLTTALNRHMLRYHINRDKLPYQCSVCNKRLTKLREKKLHEANKHGIISDLKKFECPVEGCGFSTYMKDSLKTHAKNVHNDTRLPCPHCDKKLKGKKTLENHINRIHLDIRPFLCQVCGNSYSNPFYLKAHIESKHSTDKKFKCEHCPYQTSVKMQFTAHIYSIHGIKSASRKEFQCEHCPFKAILRSKLRLHARIHSPEKNYACDQCGKTFAAMETLRGHKQWVHSDVKHKCTLCSYVTKTKKSLQQHVNIRHIFKGFRPYRCPYCPYTCVSGGNTRKHVANRHPGMEVRHDRDEEMVRFMKEYKKGLSADDDQW